MMDKKSVSGRTDGRREELSILVPGGAGYLGSVITRKLLQRGYRVRVLDALLHGDQGIAVCVNNPRCELIRDNIMDIRVLQRAVKGVHAVVHVAAIVGDPACNLMPDTTISVNYLSTALLAQCCKLYGVQRFIFASTCSVYGVGDDVLTEESSLHPVSLYAESKIRAEEALLDMADGGFCPTILRKATLYGLSQRMRFDLALNVLTARAVLDGQIPIFGGSQWRPFLHVSDAADVYVQCLETPLSVIGGQVFNVGDETQNLQLLELGQIVKAQVPTAQLIVDENLDKRSYRVNFSKLKNLLGFSARLTIADGVREIVEAFARGDFSENYREKIYHNFLREHTEYYRNALRSLYFRSLFRIAA